MTDLRLKWRCPSLLMAGVLLLAAPGFAQDSPGAGPQCAPAEPMLETGRLLRALSLDLRGRLPTVDEVEAVGDQPDVPMDLIEGWLDTDAFAAQALQRHRAILWNTITNQNLFNASSGLSNTAGRLWRRNRGVLYRGATVPCEDAPARFAPDGSILTRAVDDAQVEGWVEVRPYFDPSTVRRVCAFDAQDALESGDGTACGSNAGFGRPDCGCGPELRWCVLGAVNTVITQSMGDALDRVITNILRVDRPYTDLFTTREAWVNGPLVHFYRHQAEVSRFRIEPLPFDRARLPDLAYTDVDTWVPITLGEEHAGVLTRAAFLLRFQTHRSRANRFYDAFLCTPFSPPDAGLEGVDADVTNPNLQERGGCAYCHAGLEPAASHWGRWSEQGISYLSPADFPAYREDCEICARTGQQCTAECRQYYITTTFEESEEPYVGMLNPYYFRREEHQRNVELGPQLLALSEVAGHRLPMCVAKRAAEWLLGRDMTEGDADWIATLAQAFVSGDYSYRNLVRDIITSARYRRVR